MNIHFFHASKLESDVCHILIIIIISVHHLLVSPGTASHMSSSKVFLSIQPPYCCKQQHTCAAHAAHLCCTYALLHSRCHVSPSSSSFICPFVPHHARVRCLHHIWSPSTYPCILPIQATTQAVPCHHSHILLSVFLPLQHILSMPPPGNLGDEERKSAKSGENEADDGEMDVQVVAEG